MSPSKPLTVNISLPYLRLLPLITGTAWFITLFTLLIYWLAADRPRYPSQNNPYVAFISDIGANALKPLFMTGGSITAIALLGTIVSVHLVFHRRFARGHHGEHHGESQPRYRKSLLDPSGSVPMGCVSVSDMSYDFRQSWTSERASITALSGFYGDGVECNLHIHSILERDVDRSLNFQSHEGR
ncbi:hypothetical protein ABVK25_007451 [Lepraria finkii]|uniref:CWH43-like N-terminal domain-containing protein n=1 Tax=Lepraria finkii TaxID=1340010 RepID=A0ABR4B4P6_9LECA